MVQIAQSSGEHMKDCAERSLIDKCQGLGGGGLGWSGGGGGAKTVPQNKKSQLSNQNFSSH